VFAFFLRSFERGVWGLVVGFYFMLGFRWACLALEGFTFCQLLDLTFLKLIFIVLFGLKNF